MDFLFSSDKKTVKDDKGVSIHSVNITIVIYESLLHHCLLQYKINFEEENGEFKCFRPVEFIGDTLVVF